jgi:HPr kinase/phosphorylase
VAKPFTVRDLVDRLSGMLELEQVGPPCGLTREITSPEVSSPGLVLSGYMDRFVGERIQVLGETEISYLWSLTSEVRDPILARYFTFAIPCVFVTKGQEFPKELADAACNADVAVLRSALKTAEFYRRVKPVLEEQFAPSTTLHGSLADVFGVGLFFTGQSGIGKSECVLDLVERGHRLVADDLVIATRRGNDVLIGRGHELQRHYMEIRGVGLIDVPAIFGVRSVRQQKRIEVVVQLTEWNQLATVDRTGLDGATKNILDVDVPLITVPLNPGKNITVIAEVIAMNHLLRYSGVDAAEVFNQRLIGRMREAAGAVHPHRRATDSKPAADVRRYLQEDDE